MNDRHLSQKRATARVDKLVDKLGKPVDANIKPAVAALLAHEFVTTGSCEGHLNRQTGGPYIMVEAPDAAKYTELMKLVLIGSEGYMQHRSKLQAVNLQERRRLQELLDKFNADKDSGTEIGITNIGAGISRLACHGVDEAEEATIEQRTKWLEAAQAEFDAFASWLTRA